MNELFRLRLCGEESTGVLGGTAPYEVILNKQCTVKEFVEYVLSIGEWWGYIGIENKEVNPFFGFPSIEYSCLGTFKHGTSMKNLRGFLNKRVINVYASGGYGRMDYILCVK